MFVCTLAIGQEAVPPQGAEIIGSILTFIASIPKVGAIVVTVLKYFGLIAGALTLVTGILKFVNVCLKFFSKPESTVLNTIILYIEKAIPYVGYFSAFNVNIPKKAV